MTIASNLKDARKRAGMSQNDLASESGVSQAQVCNIERGKKPNPGIYTIQKLAIALNVTVDDLIKGEKE